jgi:hypothetical protein
MGRVKVVKTGEENKALREAVRGSRSARRFVAGWAKMKAGSDRQELDLITLQLLYALWDTPIDDSAAWSHQWSRVDTIRAEIMRMVRDLRQSKAKIKAESETKEGRADLVGAEAQGA